jgi:hypothetical protein
MMQAQPVSSSALNARLSVVGHKTRTSQGPTLGMTLGDQPKWGPGILDTYAVHDKQTLMGSGRHP